MRGSLGSITTAFQRRIGLGKPLKKFYEHVLALPLSISQRINFRQLARHSSCVRLHFEQYLQTSFF
ncbi:hypothetical protein ACFSKU_11020 [Pontibacter silvestris]|uniref:Uncharacterized protein n=1 Tax=Pontibacter silvestris TaxID=2305183 RepID=A0ABW4WZG8_9BACT